MINKDLFEALRDIDAELILEAAPIDKNKRTFSNAQLLKWGMAVACLCISVIVTLSIVLRMNRDCDQNTLPPIVVDKVNGNTGATLDDNSSEMILDMLERDGWTNADANEQGDYSITVANEVIQYDSTSGELRNITKGRVLILDPNDRESLNLILQSLYPDESTSEQE